MNWMAQGEGVIQAATEAVRGLPPISKRRCFEWDANVNGGFLGSGFFVVEFSVTFEGKAVGQAAGAHSSTRHLKISFEQHQCQRCIS
jgi:hypothetical protein